MKRKLAGALCFALGLFLQGCYAYRDTGVNASQPGANPEQGVLNSMNRDANPAPPADSTSPASPSK